MKNRPHNKSKKKENNNHLYYEGNRNLLPLQISGKKGHLTLEIILIFVGVGFAQVFGKDFIITSIFTVAAIFFHYFIILNRRLIKYSCLIISFVIFGYAIVRIYPVLFPSTTADKQNDFQLKVFIVYDSTSHFVDMDLLYNQDWNTVFNLAMHLPPTSKVKNKFDRYSHSISDYKILDLNSESWISPPTIVSDLHTNRIALVYNKTVTNSFYGEEESIKAKAFSLLIKRVYWSNFP